MWRDPDYGMSIVGERLDEIYLALKNRSQVFLHD